MVQIMTDISYLTCELCIKRCVDSTCLLVGHFLNSVLVPTVCNLSFIMSSCDRNTAKPLLRHWEWAGSEQWCSTSVLYWENRRTVLLFVLQLYASSWYCLLWQQWFLADQGQVAWLTKWLHPSTEEQPGNNACGYRLFSGHSNGHFLSTSGQVLK